MPRTEICKIVKCAEHDCVWNHVHWTNGENYANGCYKLTDLKFCKGKTSVEEAKKKGLI